MKNVVIVAPHFPPSNLAGVHRARLFSQYIEEFGWRPTIVTTHWKYYEEKLDWNLAALVDPSLEVISTPALPTKPIRTVGDIGVRAMPWHLAALRRLRREGRMDFLLITVPSFYSAILGQLLYREQPLPFGIDYIDPWVHVWPQAEVRYSKAWASMKLGELLEPWAVRNASLITAVAPGYYEGVLSRNPHLQSSAVTAAMPYGFSARDFDPQHIANVPLTVFNPSDGLKHIVYAGALLPKAHAVMDRLMSGIALWMERDPGIVSNVRFHFIGTGRSPNDPLGHNVLPVAERHGVQNVVTEHPHRMNYIDVLAHLGRSHGVLVIGSTEAHYTPSKVFQAVQSRRPVLAFLHAESTAVDVLRESGAGKSLLVGDGHLPTREEVANALHDLILGPYDPAVVNWGAFDAFSSRASAKKLAASLDSAILQWNARRFDQ